MLKSVTQIMLVKCPRIKRVYLRFCFAVLIVVSIIIFLRLIAVEKGVAVTKPVFLNASVFEAKLQQYESRIIPNLGHHGESAYLEGSDAKKGEEALKKYALNTVLSDRMPLNRKLRDPRNPKYVQT